jgi:hypothetical protein
MRVIKEGTCEQQEKAAQGRAGQAGGSRNGRAEIARQEQGSSRQQGRALQQQAEAAQEQQEREKDDKDSSESRPQYQRCLHTSTRTDIRQSHKALDTCRHAFHNIDIDGVGWCPARQHENTDRSSNPFCFPDKPATAQ